MQAPENPKRPVPIWAWPFAIACFAIPVISLGGAIPTGLGVGGGFYCLAISREAGKSTYRKLSYCGVTMAVAWTLFLALAGGVAMLQNKAPGLFKGGSEKHAQETQTAPRSTTAPVSGGNTVAADTRFAPEPPVHSAENLDEATLHKIYAKAVSLRDDIERAVVREREFRAKGMGETAAKQVEHIRGMHESRQEFTAKFYDISREELDEIVARGDRERWPVD